MLQGPRNGLIRKWPLRPWSLMHGTARYRLAMHCGRGSASVFCGGRVRACALEPFVLGLLWPLGARTPPPPCGGRGLCRFPTARPRSPRKQRSRCVCGRRGRDTALSATHQPTVVAACQKPFPHSARSGHHTAHFWRDLRRDMTRGGFWKQKGKPKPHWRGPLF